MDELAAGQDWLPSLSEEGRDFAAAPLTSRGARVFGGEMMAQSARAAGFHLCGYRVHAISTQFLRPGDMTRPVRYGVEVLARGRRFARAEVRASQEGRLRCLSILSFAADSLPEEPQSDPLPQPMAEPVPEDRLRKEHPDLFAILSRRDALEKDVTEITRDGRTLELRFRPRHRGTVNGSELAIYASDRLVLCSAQTATAFSHGLGGASGLPQVTLNHEVRIHRPIDATSFLFQRIRTQVWGTGRAFVTGVTMDGSGNRLASFSQEGLIG